MGDRISIQFSKTESWGVVTSPVLFNHWGGTDFKTEAEEYLDALIDEQLDQHNSFIQPLDRLEPETVMVDFIRHITKDMERVKSSLYLCADETKRDNSDNGHHVLNLDDWLSKREKCRKEDAPR